MGDALASALLQERHFSVEDFAMLHPAGDIGKRLLLRVDDVMRTGDDIAKINEKSPLTQAILMITTKRLGATCVMNESGHLVGIITDGDLRRLMEKDMDIHKLSAGEVMSRNPKRVKAGVLAVEALHVMEEFSINQLIITDEKDEPVGMIHIHDLLKAGLA
jgi:arabinose-5-phosphate isomerase